MNNIHSTVTYIEHLLKTAGITPASQLLIQKRRRRKSPLREPHPNMQAIQERSFQDIEQERAVPTWLDIAINHLENYANIRRP